MLRKNFPGRKRQRRVVALKALQARGDNPQRKAEIATLERKLEATSEYRNA